MALTARLTIGCIVYALLETLFPRGGKRSGLYESAAKIAAIALILAVFDI